MEEFIKWIKDKRKSNFKTISSIAGASFYRFKDDMKPKDFRSSELAYRRKIIEQVIKKENG